VNAIRRVVFDTSTLVAAALKEGSTPDRALQKAFHRCVLCASEETLGELSEVLKRSKFDAYLGLESRMAFVELIRRNAHLVAVDEDAAGRVAPACRDAKDDKFLALVLAAEADILVSSDDDLLVLHSWQGIEIMTPAKFLDQTLQTIP
jgi:putative PIN family toxin of toxin-antitoxin system